MVFLQRQCDFMDRTEDPSVLVYCFNIISIKAKIPTTTNFLFKCLLCTGHSPKHRIHTSFVLSWQPCSNQLMPNSHCLQRRTERLRLYSLEAAESELKETHHSQPRAPQRALQGGQGAHEPQSHATTESHATVLALPTTHSFQTLVTTDF